MKKRFDISSERRARLVLTYFLGLFVGILGIYFFQCRIHMYMKDQAVTAAEDYGATGDIEDYEIYTNSSILIKGEEGFKAIRVYYDDRDFPQEELIESEELSGYYDSRSVFLSVPLHLNPFKFVAVAGAPCYLADGSFAGEIYLTNVIPYMVEIMLVFWIIWTAIFGALSFTKLTEEQAREDITNIYHQYIANISHELKTPIASIQAITETLSEGITHDEATRSRYYGIISSESRQLEHAVLEIIELSKIQDPNMDFPKEKVAPGELFGPIKELYEPRCEDIGIEFVIEDSIWELPTMFTNKDRLSQVLEILLDNAYKFVKEDEGKITISATSTYNQATIRVTDNGRGITDEDLPHIFERFYKTMVDNPTGSGLGLAIAKEIVSGLEERIWVRSEVGWGTTFFLTVQLKR